jgi:hydrogenase expression/formation protein HypC
MCIALPMRVLSVRPGYARSVDGQGRELDVDVALVDAVRPDMWLLVFHGAAREILDVERAQGIQRALQALESALQGDVEAIDRAFPDLVGREPQLPDFLR